MRRATDGSGPTPYLRLDVTRALARYAEVSAVFGTEAVHYPVRTNAHPQLIFSLAQAGCRFSVASPAEVALVLAAGAEPRDLVYANPVKRRRDIASAHGAGVGLFVADSLDEVAKLAVSAPGSAVLVRWTTDTAGSGRPHPDAAGCGIEEVVDLLRQADRWGLAAAGIAVRVNSRPGDLTRWRTPFRRTAQAFARLRSAGLTPWLLDLVDGLPTAPAGTRLDLAAVTRGVQSALVDAFGAERPTLIVEPGRAMVDDAGTLVAEVLGVSWRGACRWVHLDVEVPSGLVEAWGAIRPRVITDRDQERCGPAVLVGPSDDRLDRGVALSVPLPLGLREGDRVSFGSAGACPGGASAVGQPDVGVRAVLA